MDARVFFLSTLEFYSDFSHSPHCFRVVICIICFVWCILYFLRSVFSLASHSFSRIVEIAVSQQSQIIQNEQSQRVCVCVCESWQKKKNETSYGVYLVRLSIRMRHSAHLDCLHFLLCFVCLCSCCFVYFAKEKLLKTSKFCISLSFFFSFSLLFVCAFFGAYCVLAVFASNIHRDTNRTAIGYELPRSVIVHTQTHTHTHRYNQQLKYNRNRKVNRVRLMHCVYVSVCLLWNVVYCIVYT